PAAVVLFDGVCADLEGIDPVFRNASGIGMERLDFMFGNVPLALFANTATEFPTGFGAEAETEVGNIQLTFVTNATTTVTGMFIPQIVAITNEMTAITDPDNVDIEWSIQFGDVTPLVNGPTTVSFSVVGIGCTFATMMLDGDSSVDSATGVTLTAVNGAPPPPPEGGPVGNAIFVERAEWDGGSDRLRVRGAVSPAGSSVTLHRSSFSAFFGDAVSDGVTCDGGRPLGNLPTDVDGEFAFDTGNGGQTFNPFPLCIESDNGTSVSVGGPTP
ncbi:MAG: hypothetical protein AAEJ52_11680, partial [Myxococcota bacterium]